MNKGKEYELLIKDIYDQLAENAIVTHDDKLYDKASKSLRQIDVSIRHKMADIEYLTIIEVKDYNKKAGIAIVEGFARVVEDVSANKGIIICAQGFSKHAIEKAKSLGIELLTYHSARNKNWETVIKSIVYRKTYFFEVNYNYSSDFVPVVKGQTVISDIFLSYNKLDLFTLHDVIRKEIIEKTSLRELSKRKKTVSFKDLSLFVIVNEEFVKITEGFLSARLIKSKEELFYIEPVDYIIKNNHIVGDKDVKKLIWDIDTIQNLFTLEVNNEKDIIGDPEIRLVAYIFSDNSSSGKIKFRTEGGIIGESVVIKGNHILGNGPIPLRAMELENKFKNKS